MRLPEPGGNGVKAEFSGNYTVERQTFWKVPPLIVRIGGRIP